MNNELYSNNDYRYYSLAHHGILGQKWGRKQGPPYPLDASDHSAAEKKAGYTKSLDKNRKSVMKDVDRTFNSKFRKRTYQEGVRKLTKSKAIQEEALKLKDSYKKVKDCEDKLTQLENDFYSNKKLYKEYAKKTADEHVEKLRKSGKYNEQELKTIHDEIEKTPGIDASVAIWERYADDNVAVRNADREVLKARNDFVRDSRKVANDLLKEYGESPITVKQVNSKKTYESNAHSPVEEALRSVARMRVIDERNKTH